MGERITFRKGRGLVVSDEGTPMPAVSITEPRVKFIKGWLTGGTDPADGSVECGDGERFNMEIIPISGRTATDVLAEIFYRVRDAWFTSGSAPYSQAGHDLSSTIQGTPNPAQLAEFHLIPGGGEFGGEGTVFTRRGYSVMMSPSNSNNFGVTYTIGGHEALVVSTNFRDAVNERAIWDGEIVDGNPTLYNFPDYSPPHSVLITGWSHTIYSYPASDSDTDIYTIGGVYGLSAPLLLGAVLVANIESTVAWVGGDHPFSPGSRMFLAAKFIHFYDEYDLSVPTGSPYASLKTDVDGDASYLHANKFVISMSGGQTASCALYGWDVHSTTVTPTDFVLTAKKWWPYKTKAGLPAWDSATGEPINGGPTG